MYQKIQELISIGRPEYALDQMLMLSNGKDPKMHNSLLLLRSKISQLYDDNRLGVIERASYVLEFSQVTNSTLDFLEEMNTMNLIVGVEKKNKFSIKDSSKIKVLFLCANPNGTAKIDIDKEAKGIRLKLRKLKEKFEFIDEYDVTVPKMMESLSIEQPDILHISCHGSEGYNHEEFGLKGIGKGFDRNEKAALVFADEKNNIDLIEHTKIVNQLKIFENKLKCVLISALYSDTLAQLLSMYIPFVIGIRGAINDKEAITFSNCFYHALTLGYDFEKAFHYSYSIAGMNENREFVLFKKYD